MFIFPVILVDDIADKYGLLPAVTLYNVSYIEMF